MEANKNQEYSIVLSICDLMGEPEMYDMIVQNPLLMNERRELSIIYKTSRMDDEDRLQAYGKVFNRIKSKLHAEEVRIQKEANNMYKLNQNAEYEKGVKINTARFNLRNTIKMKRNRNQKEYANTATIPKNINRILRSGKFAKPENAKQAKNFMNARQSKRNTLVKQLAKYNELNARLNGKHYPIETYYEMKKEIE